MAKKPGDDAKDDTIGQGTIGGPAKLDAETPASITNGGGPSDDLILKYVAQIDAQQGEVDKWEAGKKAALKGMTTIRQRAKGDGIKLKNLDAAMKKRTLARFEQREDITEQDRYDRLLGNETFETADLFGNLPDGTKDDVDFDAAGYAAGKALHPAEPPKTVPPTMVQHWLKGHERGTNEMLKALGGEKPAPIIGVDDGPEGGDE